jgi:hypothetical protein
VRGGEPGEGEAHRAEGGGDVERLRERRTDDVAGEVHDDEVVGEELRAGRRGA